MTDKFRLSLGSSLHGPVGSTSESHTAWHRPQGQGRGERDRVEPGTSGWDGVDIPKWNSKDPAGLPRSLWNSEISTGLGMGDLCARPSFNSTLSTSLAFLYQMGIPTPRGRLWKFFINHIPVVLNGRQFCPPGTFGNVQIFGCHNWGCLLASAR